MNTTNVVSLAVLSIACFSSDQESRLRTSAIRIAPVAPIAPPSVGVATPRKIVPSTRKIRASGGISTNVTFCAMPESRLSFSSRLTIASANATPMPISMQMTMVSSSGLSAGMTNLA